MSTESLQSRSARVSCAGDGVARDLQEKFHYILRNPWNSGVAKQTQDYPWVWTQDDERRKESSFRRDAETSTRDACATPRRES